MNLFKGYIETRNKMAIRSFKDCNSKDLLTIEQAKMLNEYAGVLNNDTVLIDIDDEEKADILFNILSDKKIKFVCFQTSRGKHFYFKNNGRFTSCKTDVPLACGLSADIKVGLKASYGVLKINGAERKRLDTLENNEVDEVPIFLTMLLKTENVFKLSEGDGRNSAIFNQQCNLANVGLTYEESVEVLKITNSYILADPISEKEFNCITRKSAFPIEIFKDNMGKFSHDKLANYLIAKYSIRKVEGSLYCYNGKYYIETNKIENSVIEHDIIKTIPNSKKNFRSEVYATIRGMLTDESIEVDSEHISFNNGIFDVKTHEFIEHHTPKYFIKNYIPHNYNPNVYSSVADKALNDWSCNDSEIRTLLEEMIGICLFTSTGVQKMFIIFGEKSNGKTTFFKVLDSLFGNVNISHLSLHDFNDKFSSILLQNKLVNIGDDISDELVTSKCLTTIKQIVTGYSMIGEHKGIDKISFKPYATLVFSTNKMPSVSDETGAFLRRLCFIPFDNKFPEDSEKRKVDFEENLLNEQSFEYLISLGIKALNRVLSNNGTLSFSQKAEDLKEKIFTHLDTVKSFVEERGETIILGRLTKDVHNDYMTFCRQNDCYSLRHIDFVKAIDNLYQFEPSSRNGHKVFVKKKLKEETTKTT